MIGLYLTNYGGKDLLTPDVIKKQCETVFAMLKAKRIFGMNFLLHDAENPEVVAWTRQWINEVGDEPLTM